jgi:hypothetical protein
VNDNGPDGKDTFYQTASLADFTLELVRDGVVIAGSDSDVDNLEHLSWTLEKSATYSLEVYRFEEGGLATENFALAARVLNASAAAATAGVSRSLSFEAGDALAMAMAAPVPEPGVGGMMAVGGLLITMRRRRRS